MAGGRPEAEINVNQVIKLAEKLWTDEQIGAFVGVHGTTIRRRFAEELDAARHRGKAILTDQLWHRINAGSDRVLIHAMDRYIGPVEKKVSVNINSVKNLTDEEKKQVLREIVNDIESNGSTTTIGPSNSQSLPGPGTGETEIPS